MQSHSLLKLDAQNGCWSILLDEISSLFKTVNTHKGRFRFLQIAFGLKLSQNVFQLHMDYIIDGLLGVTAIHNDICVCHKTPHQHDTHLIQPMQNASRVNLVFNDKNAPSTRPILASALFMKNGMKP